MEFEFTSSWFTGLVGGVVIGAAPQLINSVKEWLQTEAEKKTRATYASLRLATILEAFAVGCANRIQEVSLYTSVPDSITRPENELPELQSYPEDIDWTSLPADLSSPVLSLPNEVTIGNDHVRAYLTVLDITGEESGHLKECPLQCGVIGLQAWHLATELRDHCGLKYKPRLRADWDFLSVLREQRDKYKLKNPDGAY